MARDPGSTWRPLPEAHDGRHTKTQLIVHSTGTTASAANNARYFERADVKVESTFIVGYRPDDPTLQVMDSRARADANLTASRRAIAIEVVGTGDQPFTAWQEAELIRIGRWAAATHPIPRRVCPAHDQGGFGWHVMFGAPGPWTTVVGKVCPGSRRITQLRTRIFPAIFTDHEEFVMASESEVRAIIREELRKADLPRQPWTYIGGGGETRDAYSYLRSTFRQVAEVRGEVAGLRSALTQLAATGSVDLDAVSKAAEDGARRAWDDVEVVIRPGDAQ